MKADTDSPYGDKLTGNPTNPREDRRRISRLGRPWGKASNAHYFHAPLLILFSANFRSEFAWSQRPACRKTSASEMVDFAKSCT
jgi:hypothetical protein